MMAAEKLDTGVTLGTKLAAMFIAGWLASSWWYGTGSFHKMEKAIPALQAEAGCEHWRAKVASNLALGTQMVDKSQIPKDCPHPKIDVPEAPASTK